MRKKLGFVVLLVAGLALGLGVAWLTGRFSPQTNSNRTASVVSQNVNNQAVPPLPTSTPLPFQNIGATQTPVAPARPVAPAAIGAEYIALGDSVAYGIGAPDPTNQGYAGLFYTNYLKKVQPNLQVYKNLAVPGETSASFLSVPSGKSQLQKLKDEIVAAANAGLRISPVSLTIGGNDMLNVVGKSKSDREAALTLFDTNFTRILTEIRTQIGQADLLVTTYYNPFAYNNNGSGIDSEWLERFDSVIRQRAQEKGAKIVDFTTPVTGNEKNLTWIASNDVHPTPAGHSVLAQALWKATGYDTTAPSMTLTYNPVGPGGKTDSNSRLVFKVSAIDDWATAITSVVDSELPGAGKLAGAWVSLDGGNRQLISTVPSRYSRVPAGGGQEFNYILDTTQLAPGQHTLKFEATDLAGNTTPMEISFTQI